MLSTLKELFDSLQPRPATESSGAQEHMLQLAAAVLLVEVMRSDVEMVQAERVAVLSALQHRFGLAADELGRLMELAEQTSRDAHDYHRFTSKINEGFDLAQKVRMSESLWQVARAGKAGAGGRIEAPPAPPTALRARSLRASKRATLNSVASETGPLSRGRLRFDVPDLLGVFADRAVGRERAHACHVRDGAADP